MILMDFLLHKFQQTQQVWHAFAKLHIKRININQQEIASCLR